MRFDRILLDIWDWIRRVLWQEQGKISQPAYAILETHKGRYGLLRRVTRDTPRAVDTWIYSPFLTKARKDAGDVQYHIVITLDHLEAIAGEKGSRRDPHTRKLPTHRIQAIRTTDLLNGEWFEGEMLFEGEWDLQGNQPRRDVYALLLMQRMFEVLIRRKIDRVNWSLEIELAGKEIMGAQWNLCNPSPPQIKTVKGIILDKEPRR